MANWDRSSGATMAFPKPGRALMVVMLALLAIWVMFAMALRWGDADPRLFELFLGNAAAIREGQVWRLFTAPFVHSPNDPWHIVGVLLGLYFLTPSLEQRWGSRRLIVFLLLSAIIGYSCQFVVESVLPDDVAAKLSSQQYWFGAIPAIEAVAVAWALNFKGQNVRLFFVLPVTATQLLWYVVGFSVLRLIAASGTAEGLISPFGGMLAGWLLGGGTPSPARKLLLRWRYRQLEREAAQSKAKRQSRVRQAPFSVIEGGRRKDDDDDTPGGRILN
jgi:membrane associated rhomboid family serine protease